MDRVTQPFRDEHARIHEHLRHVRTWSGKLAGADPSRSRELAGRVVGFFEGHLGPHAAWEERVLYPVVDRYAASRPEHPFTASLRHEHRIVERWLADLRAHLAAEDWQAFARRADSLLGLVEAHFEEEEVVLLPIIDARMTRE
jgi:hemerythrin-like domain-containing protein